MIRSRVLDDWAAIREAELLFGIVKETLETKFGLRSPDLIAELEAVKEPDRLRQLQTDAMRAPTLDDWLRSFRRS